VGCSSVATRRGCFSLWLFRGLKSTATFGRRYAAEARGRAGRRGLHWGNTHLHVRTGIW
jgi:hypothetical protein